MKIVFARNLLTIPKAWGIWWDFLTNSNIPIFSYFLLFSHFFHKSQWLCKLSLPDLRLRHVHRVIFDSIRRHFAYHIIRIIGAAENGTQKIVPNEINLTRIH